MKKIQLTRGKFAIVSEADYEIVKDYKWYAHKALSNRWYARSAVVGFMHRFLTGVQEEMSVDHINGDSLDNRQENLRICSHLENLRNKKIYRNNKSGYKGVYFDKGKNRWIAQVVLGGKKITRSSIDPEKAALLYDELAREYFGEYAKVNFE